MPRLLAVLALAAFATGCGPNFYERCVLGVWQRAPSSEVFKLGLKLVVVQSPEVLAARLSRTLIAAGFSEEEVKAHLASISGDELRDQAANISKYDESKTVAFASMQAVEALCAELDTRRRAR